MATHCAQLADALSAYAFNRDGTQVALCPHTNEVHVYKLKQPGAFDFERTEVLQGHDQLVSGIDWAPNSNLLVSCSHDRNAYVWQQTPEGWTHQMVITRLNRAALCVRWSPSEAKFAIGSGAKQLCVCYFESANNWWTCRLIKKRHDSSIVSIAWHPNSSILATGSTDFKCRVFNAMVAEVDGPPDSASCAVLRSTAFGDLLLEVDGAGSWVHSVAWSPAGDALAFSTHDSTLRVVGGIDVAGSSTIAALQVTESLRLPCLPLKCIHFLYNDVIIGGGWDGTVLMITRQPSGQLTCEAVGTGSRSLQSQTSQTKVATNIAAKLEMLKLQQTGRSPLKQLEQVYSNKAGATGGRLHTNCIIQISAHTRVNGTVPGTFTSGDLDGKLALWKIA